MKLASFNVENLFERAHAMNLANQGDGKGVLQKHAEMNKILSKTHYSPTDKTKIVSLMKALGIDKRDDGGEFVILRQNRGHLVNARVRGLVVCPMGVLTGSDSWTKMEAVNEYGGHGKGDQRDRSRRHLARGS
jgi:hypothetical protein